jgi:hypothetical protein
MMVMMVTMEIPQRMKRLNPWWPVREEDLQVCEESQHVRVQRPLERRVSSSKFQQDQAQAQKEGGQGEECDNPLRKIPYYCIGPIHFGH